MTSELERTLQRHGIPLARWGQGTAKTVADLAAELARGEARLHEDPRSGELLRLVRVAEVDVLARDRDGRVRRLIEENQQFADGRMRHRELERSLAEKLLPGERPILAARRALQEELGVRGATIRRAGRPHTRTQESGSYPGLRTKYELIPYTAWLPPESVRDQYIEDAAAKRTTFRWAAA